MEISACLNNILSILQNLHVRVWVCSAYCGALLLKDLVNSFGKRLIYTRSISIHRLWHFSLIN